jgi:hypothetical protein
MKNKSFAKIIANLITQVCFKYRNKFKCKIEDLKIKPVEINLIAQLIFYEYINNKEGQILLSDIIEKRKDGIL